MTNLNCAKNTETTARRAVAPRDNLTQQWSVTSHVSSEWHMFTRRTPWQRDTAVVCHVSRLFRM